MGVARYADERVCHVFLSASEFVAVPAEDEEGDGTRQFGTALRGERRPVGYADARFVGLSGGAGTVAARVTEGLRAPSSEKLPGPFCLQRKDKNGDTHYYHTVVGATLARAGSHDILPLDAEAVRHSDGKEKQDGEINAGKRLVTRLREEHRQLRYGFVLVAKPTSQQELFAWVEDLERLGACVKGQWTQGPLRKRRFFASRIAAQIPLTQSDAVQVNFVEVWERNKAGKVIYHNSWVTDFAVTAQNVTTVMGIGRSRWKTRVWKIENEPFNVHKNHGYELEHNYGHGQHSLSLVFYLLNLLAFVAHLVLERGDRQYQQTRTQESRRSL